MTGADDVRWRLEGDRFAGRSRVLQAVRILPDLTNNVWTAVVAGVATQERQPAPSTVPSRFTEWTPQP